MMSQPVSSSSTPSKIDEAFSTLRTQVNGIDASRGQPPEALHDLSTGKLTTVGPSDCKINVGTRVVDLRNYTGADLIAGLPEARSFFGGLMGHTQERTLVWNQSSLELMATLLRHFDLHGGATSADSGWLARFGLERKIMVSVPAYDRHIRLLEANGFTVIGVPSLGDRPDLDAMEAISKADPSVVGVILNPRYNNPECWTMSAADYLRLATLQSPNRDFVVISDDAYFAHALRGEPPSLPDLVQACVDAGHPERAWIFGSTSKVTFSGAGVAWCVSSEGAIRRFGSYLWENTIRPDHINQLRELRFLAAAEGGFAGHMRRCAALLLPSFQAMEDELAVGAERMNKAFPGSFLSDRVSGGYFIPLRLAPGTAQRVVDLMKERLGITITSSTGLYPKGYDSPNNFLRLCPSRLSVEQARLVAQSIVLCSEWALAERQAS